MSDALDMQLRDLLGQDLSPAGSGVDSASNVDVAVLQALGSMAQATSCRLQGEVLIAVRRAGLAITAADTLAALENLSRAGLVVGLMTLTDGGVVATLSPLAMAQLQNRR